MPTATRSSKTDRYGKSSRYYDVPGVGKLVSVTTALSVVAKPALVAWSAKLERAYVVEEATKLYAEYGAGMPAEYFGSTLVTRLSKQKQHVRALETAGDLGTRIHALVEMHSRDRKAYENAMSFVPTEGPEGIALRAWEKWTADTGFQPTEVEKFVHNAKHRYAGAYDVRGIIEGEDWLLDAKSSSGIYETMFWQLAAYGEAIFEMGEGIPDREAVVRLPKAPGDDIEVALVPNHAECFAAFLAALALWRHVNGEVNE